MVSKARMNYIISLQKRKAREEERVYVIEGDKLVKEYMATDMQVYSLIAKPEFISSLSPAARQKIDEIVPASFDELKKISTLKTPHNALAVIKMPESSSNPEPVRNILSVALDCIQDPGNLGTIIRAAAWFGISHIYCSPDSVDVYNPKVIQASMGAILHVNVFYSDLPGLLGSSSKAGFKIFGAFIDGESIYTHHLGNEGIILLGNESKGISDELLPFVTDKIMIPRFSEARIGIDSLNVGMAASVIFAEFRRGKS